MKHIKQHVRPYRAAVGMMVVNHKNEVFVARRLDTKAQAWQMPQGGIDMGESPLEAVMRELKEEIGTNNVRIIAESRDWYHYDLPPFLVNRLWNGLYRGQRQKWFAARFLGEDAEINLETHHPEFCDWKWVSVETLPSLAVSFKRKNYEDLIEELWPAVLKDGSL